MQKWFTNCHLIIRWQNLPKLWCQYEFIVHNQLRNSEVIPRWIQPKIFMKVAETDSQKRFSNSKTVKTIIYTSHVLASVLVSSNCQDPVYLHDHNSDAACKMWWLSVSEIDSSVSSIRKKISYRKHVHHNPSSKYASRCWEKREWLHVLWDNWNYFLKFVRIE